MQAPSEALFLAQIVLLLLVGRLMGEAMQRIGQPAVMGQLIAGILLGPSVFGSIWPEAQRAVFAAGPQQKSMIDAVSQLGILMLLLLTGMETDLRLVKKARRDDDGREPGLAWHYIQPAKPIQNAFVESYQPAGSANANGPSRRPPVICPRSAILHSAVA